MDKSTLHLENLECWGETRGPIGNPFIVLNQQLVDLTEKYLFKPLQLILACTIVHELGHCWIRMSRSNSPKKLSYFLHGNEFGFVMEYLLFDTEGEGVHLLLKKNVCKNMSNAKFIKYKSVFIN